MDIKASEISSILKNRSKVSTKEPKCRKLARFCRSVMALRVFTAFDNVQAEMVEFPAAFAAWHSI